jgi:NitT/TauT family transport system substrate-binding protein
MQSLSYLKQAGKIAVVAAAMGVAAPQVMAEGEMGSMHVAFGDVPGGEMVGFMVAVARAAERGVEVETSFMQSEEIAAQAVVAGQADIGVGTPYALIQNFSNAPIRMFYQLANLRFYPVVNGEKYQSWSDLDGAAVGVHGRGSGTEAIMLLMAKQNGVEYSEVSYIPGSSVRAGALLNGTLDVSIVDYERRVRLEKEAPGRFIFLPLPEINATDEALYASREWLENEKEAVAILMEELIKTWREINDDPSVIVALREQYNVLPDLEQEEVDELLPATADGVKIALFPNNGGSVEAVMQDFEFFTASGSLKGNAADLKVEDFWYLDPINAAVEKLGKR